MEDYLNMNEKHKCNIIKDVVSGRKTKQRAEIELNLSRRQIVRLIQKYHQEGRRGFRYKNSSRKPSTTIDCQTRKQSDQFLTQYSIPHRILTDYRSIFSGAHAPKKGAAIEKQDLT